MAKSFVHNGVTLVKKRVGVDNECKGCKFENNKRPCNPGFPNHHCMSPHPVDKTNYMKVRFHIFVEKK